MTAGRGQREFPENVVDSSSIGRTSDEFVMSESRSRTNVTILQTSSSDQSEDFVSAYASMISFDDAKNSNGEQRVIEGNRIKVYRCGQKLYAKLDETDEDADDCYDPQPTLKLFRKDCARRFNLKNPELKIFAPRRNQMSDMSLSLRRPYGIQLGSFNIGSQCFAQKFQRKHALDVVLVAHGMASLQDAVCWSQQDIDNILLLGTELHKQTSEVVIDKLSQLTKGFTYQKQTVQVTMSEPVIVGRLLTFDEHSVDLRHGLEKFFNQHKQGILQAPGLDLYVSLKRQTFFVFDPEGRTIDCVRCKTGEAAFMIFSCLDNVFHLIFNLSGIEVKSPFKICKVEVTQIMEAKHSPEKFYASSGNPNSKPRSDDYKLLNDQVAYLQGSVHFNSIALFGKCGNKQQLTSSIMAIVYAKIDPPNSWSKVQLDRVLHFGTQLYRELLQGEPTKNITLLDIPSKFYIGNFYRIGISLVPFTKRVKLARTRVFCDNSITKALRCLFEKAMFRCFLLQLGINTFAVWQMATTEVFYFFDGQQRDLNGHLDHNEGTSILFMTANLEKLCSLVVQRVMSQPQAANATLEVHGIKVVEISKLTEKEKKCKKGFRVKKLDHLRPMTPEIAKTFEEPPSTVDSITAVLTNDQIKRMLMQENLLDENLKTPKFNSTSPVCCNAEAGSEDATPGEVKESISLFTSNLVQTVFSGILEKITQEDGELNGECDKPEQPRVDKKPCGAGCGKFVAYVDKIYLKREDSTDVNPLETQHFNSKASVVKSSASDLSGSEYLLAE